MKKFAIVLVLIMVCAIPASARTCRNGKMTVYHSREITVYHNKNYGRYPVKHVWTDGTKGNVKPNKSSVHNGEITVYHNKNYGPYPVQHVWTDGTAN